MLSEARPSLRGERESKHLVFGMREHHYYVYMMISGSRRALYIGVTNNLHRRVFEHKNDEFEGFSQEYRAHRLVWFERYSNIHTAHCAGETAKGVATLQEELAGADDESRMERSECGVGQAA